MADFDASRYLTKLKGKDYLEVKWRLLWLRTDHPDAIIATEMVRLDEGMALFKAKVSIPNGGEATGWGSETSQDFGDFIEKAETKALGRSLAALGFGTQFCEDHSFGTDETGRPVDHPGSRRDLPKPSQAASVKPAEGEHWCSVHNVAFKGNSHWYAHPTGDGKFCNEERSVNKQTGEVAEPPAANAQPAVLCSEAQIKAIYTITEKEHERRDEEVEEVCHNLYGVKVTALTKSQASEFIDRLKAKTVEWTGLPAPEVVPPKPDAASPERERLSSEITAYASHLSISMRELDGLSDKEDGVARWEEANIEWLKELKRRLETRLRNNKVDPKTVLAAANL